LNAIDYLNPAHKSGDAWTRIASSVQSRGGRPLILECASCQDCTLEAMRTQVFANQFIDCIVVLFAHPSINITYRQSSEQGRAQARTTGRKYRRRIGAYRKSAGVEEGRQVVDYS
jgi:hypothetical protein